VWQHPAPARADRGTSSLVGRVPVPADPVPVPPLGHDAATEGPGACRGTDAGPRRGSGRCRGPGPQSPPRSVIVSGCLAESNRGVGIVSPPFRRLHHPKSKPRACHTPVVASRHKLLISKRLGRGVRGSGEMDLGASSAAGREGRAPARLCCLEGSLAAVPRFFLDTRPGRGTIPGSGPTGGGAGENRARHRGCGIRARTKRPLMRGGLSRRFGVTRWLRLNPKH
jgi:hypothetical protein